MSGRGLRGPGLFAAALLLMGTGAGAADLAFITSQNSNALSVIDLGTAQVVASAAIPGAPAPVAYDAARGRVFVIAADTGRLSVLDEAAQITGGADVGAGAFGLAVAPDGGLFVTDWYGATLRRLSPDLGEVWRVPTGLAPAGVAVSPDGAVVATADRDADRVSLFDATSGALRAQVAVGAHPFAVVFHPDGRLFSADVQAHQISVIDPAKGAVTGTVPTGSHPYGVAFAGGRGFVTDQYAATMTVFDDTTLAVIATIPVGDYPEGVAALPDGSGVVIANWDSDTVQVIDAATLAIRAEIEVPAGPRAFGLFTGRSMARQVRP